MLKVISQAFLGILIIFVGIYVGYLYLTRLNNGVSPLLLVLAIAFLGAGVFLLLHAGKSDITVEPKLDYAKSENEATGSSDKLDTENMFEKNKALVKEWEDTSNKRDKLKILGAAANEEK